MRSMLMAARPKGQIPARIKLFDSDNGAAIEEALKQWSPWLHLTDETSVAEKERAMKAKDIFERQEDRLSLFYLRKSIFPWLWAWIERFHGTSLEAEVWRCSNPQSEMQSQV